MCLWYNVVDSNNRMTSFGWTCTTLAGLLMVLMSVKHFTRADTVQGMVTCMNNEECTGAHRRCFHNKSSTVGRCVCEDGFVAADPPSIKCDKELRHECDENSDCSQEEVCMTWQVPPNGFSRNFYENLDPPSFRTNKRQRLCVGAWLFNSELIDGPRTGGGLKHRFYPDDFFFRRRPRSHQQYIGFVEDMMLILFLICILVTLIAVHRASCYRQFLEARRNTPLRYILPIAEDRPPPYTDQRPDTVDGLTSVVVGEGSGSDDKGRSETPPPSYDEALTRVQLPSETSAPQSLPQPATQDPELPTYTHVSLPPIDLSTQSPLHATDANHSSPFSLDTLEATFGDTDGSIDVYDQDNDSPKIESSQGSPDKDSLIGNHNTELPFNNNHNPGEDETQDESNLPFNAEQEPTISLDYTSLSSINSPKWEIPMLDDKSLTTGDVNFDNIPILVRRPSVKIIPSPPDKPEDIIHSPSQLHHQCEEDDCLICNPSWLNDDSMDGNPSKTGDHSQPANGPSKDIQLQLSSILDEKTVET